MEAIQADKLRHIVFERLIAGETREQLLVELCRKLDEEKSRSIIASAVDLIAAQKENGQYLETARRVRNRRINNPYVVWKRFGFILLIGGGTFMLLGLLVGIPALALGPIVGGFVILVVVEPKINAYHAEASAAVDRLFVEEF